MTPSWCETAAAETCSTNFVSKPRTNAKDLSKTWALAAVAAVKVYDDQNSTHGIVQCLLLLARRLNVSPVRDWRFERVGGRVLMPCWMSTGGCPRSSRWDGMLLMEVHASKGIQVVQYGQKAG